MKSKYPIFEILLKQENLKVLTNEGKELLIKNLMPEPEKFKHLFRPDYVIEHKEQIFVIEIEGGVFTNGRHTRGKGFFNDMLKYNALTCIGIPILRFEAGMIKDTPAQVVEFIKKFANSELSTEEISEFIKRFKK